MKLTKQQLKQMIKEEIAQLTGTQAVKESHKMPIAGQYRGMGAAYKRDDEDLQEQHRPYTVGDLQNLARGIPADYRVEVTYRNEPLEIDEVYDVEEDRVVRITVRTAT